ncbi:hypothetical protein DICPUDRAFT_84586 [Dictyostelium purpureum]|uniref:Uncharacterized protein n=1 Tax=Dictyostelium purpureum TaxID=5786 RepID=F1A341_DICPU|nr:uncharacterized protein DICPUDRAFT_84586 [Dictyostelium purpureum]EGC29384.1 hypothetical protein DICPUDRAFT_84586 [Dictyostelium purpureum]|eukprot:XP_003294085.1 hypothetical protein DICPUDRAFT_84586 [Dictyostelium purpureum]
MIIHISLYHKYHVKIYDGINWFSPFPGFDNKFPKELSSLENFTSQEYSSIIDDINLIIKTNDIKKRRFTVYLLLSILVGLLGFFFLFGPWYVFLISSIIISFLVVFFSVKLYYSNTKLEREVKETIRDYNQKYSEKTGFRIVFKPKLRKTSTTYQYKLIIFYPFSYQQLQLIRLYNQYHQQNQSLDLPSSSSLPSSTFSNSSTASSFFNIINNGSVNANNINSNGHGGINSGGNSSLNSNFNDNINSNENFIV